MEVSGTATTGLTSYPNTFWGFLHNQNIIRLATGILIGKAIANLIKVTIQDFFHPLIDPNRDFTLTWRGEKLSLDRIIDQILFLLLALGIGYSVYLVDKKYLSRS